MQIQNLCCCISDIYFPREFKFKIFLKTFTFRLPSRQILSYTDDFNPWYKIFLISIYRWKGPKKVGDVKINLCFVAIVNKENKIPGEIHWHSLKVFKTRMAMQKVVLHLIIYNYRQLQKAVIYNIIIITCQCLQVFTVFCIFNQPHSSSMCCSCKKHKHCHWDIDPQNMTNINLKTCIETLSTIYSYSTTFLF